MPRLYWKRCLIRRCRFFSRIFYSSRSPVYVKCLICLLILYFLNLLIQSTVSHWSEKSFEDEYHLTIKQIDVIQLEENAEKELGPATNILSNRFMIANENFCGRSIDAETRLDPHLLILVKSSIENVAQRQAIRITWANKYYSEINYIKVAFVLGTDPHNTSVTKESEKYGDIIQIDKIDYYYYSSYKMIMMLRWINEYCTSKSRRAPHTDLRNYVLFVDDDYYLDLNLLLSYIHRIDEDREMTTYERRTFLTGNLISGSRPRRSIHDRWYVSVIDYPYDGYPPYISSECFLMTRYNARLFYIRSKYTRLFHFDYIYMGLLAYSMSTKLIENNQLFSTSDSQINILNNQNGFFSQWKNILNSETNSNLSKQSISRHGYRGEKLVQLWNQIHHMNLTLSLHN